MFYCDGLLSLSKHDLSVCLDMLPFLRGAAGPLDLQPVYRIGTTKTEKKGHLIVRVETGSAHHFVDLPAPCGLDCNSRPDGTAIRLAHEPAAWRRMRARPAL